MMKQTCITTAKQAIEVLGGSSAVANWYGLPQSQVSAWGTRNQISRGYLLHVYLSLRKRGLAVDPKVFGLTTWDRLIIPSARGRKRRARAA